MSIRYPSSLAFGNKYYSSLGVTPIKNFRVLCFLKFKVLSASNASKDDGTLTLIWMLKSLNPYKNVLPDSVWMSSPYIPVRPLCYGLLTYQASDPEVTLLNITMYNQWNFAHPIWLLHSQSARHQNWVIYSATDQSWLMQVLFFPSTV